MSCRWMYASFGIALTRAGYHRGLRACDRLLVHDNTANNIGFAAGAKAAAARGSDGLVLFVNPDGDLPRATVTALEAALDDPEVVAAAANLRPMNPPASADGTQEWLSGACFVTRRTAFEKVGGFDERLFMYGEDVDLGFKSAGPSKARDHR